MWFDGKEYEYARTESHDLNTKTKTNDLTSYLLGEHSELRPLLEAVSRAQSEAGRRRAALEYLLVLASARHAASGQGPESRAMAQVRAQYGGVFARDRSEHAQLIKALHKALTSGASLDILAGLKLLGLYHRQHGAYGLARAGFGVATELAARVGDPHEELNTLFWLGVTERYLGHLDRAEAVHERQLRLARRVDTPGQAVLAQENLGLVLLRRGRIGEARERVLRALSEAKQLEDRELQGYCYHALLLVETEAERPGEAASCGWEAYRRYESLEQRLRALQDCAVLLYNWKMYTAAQAAWEIILQETNDNALVVRSLIGLTDVAARLGDEPGFNELVQKTLGEENLVNLAVENIEALRTAGLGYAQFGDIQRGRQYLIRSVSLAENSGYEKLASEISAQLESLGSPIPAPEHLDVSATEYARLRDVAENVQAERARKCA